MGRSHQNTLSVARGGSTGCRSLGRGRGAADPLPIHSLPEGRRPAGQHGTPTLVFKVQEQLDKRVQWQVSRSLLQSRAAVVRAGVQATGTRRQQPEPLGGVWCRMAVPLLHTTAALPSRPAGRGWSGLCRSYKGRWKKAHGFAARSCGVHLRGTV